MDNEFERVEETNAAELTGRILAAPQFSHRTYGEAFYYVMMGIDRRSGYEDVIKLMVSQRLMGSADVVPGNSIRVSGQVRTYNEEEDGRNRLNIVVFVKEFEIIEGEEDAMHENKISLQGFICKKPVFRVSPLGREICDIMLAVNRMYSKSDYIPCIAWGRNAVFAERLCVGDRLWIVGRIQSREYRKKDEEGNVLIKTAYEVSILKIEE